MFAHFLKHSTKTAMGIVKFCLPSSPPPTIGWTLLQSTNHKVLYFKSLELYILVNIIIIIKSDDFIVYIIFFNNHDIIIFKQWQDIFSTIHLSRLHVKTNK